MQMGRKAADLLGGQRCQEPPNDEAFTAHLSRPEHHESIEGLGEWGEAVRGGADSERAGDLVDVDSNLGIDIGRETSDLENIHEATK